MKRMKKSRKLWKILNYYACYLYFLLHKSKKHDIWVLKGWQECVGNDPHFHSCNKKWLPSFIMHNYHHN